LVQSVAFSVDLSTMPRDLGPIGGDAERADQQVLAEVKAVQEHDQSALLVWPVGRWRKWLQPSATPGGSPAPVSVLATMPWANRSVAVKVA
jgi:hypothetical protein